MVPVKGTLARNDLQDVCIFNWVQALHDEGATTLDPSNGEVTVLQCILALENLNLAVFS